MSYLLVMVIMMVMMTTMLKAIILALAILQDQGDRMLTRVKLGDFGVARKVGTMVCKVCDGTTYTPPEICSLARHAYYRVERSADVWSLGVVIFCLMTGSFPWQLADLNIDPLFQRLDW